MSMNKTHLNGLLLHAWHSGHTRLPPPLTTLGRRRTTGNQTTHTQNAPIFYSPIVCEASKIN